MSTRLTRKPGVLVTGRGRRRMRRAKALALSMVCGEVSGPCTISTSGIFATGLKKCIPTRREGSFSAGASSCSGMLEVLVARMASSGTWDSTSANRSRLTCASSKTASITSSALRNPYPGRSGIRRSRAAMALRRGLSFLRYREKARLTTRPRVS